MSDQKQEPKDLETAIKGLNSVIQVMGELKSIDSVSAPEDQTTSNTRKLELAKMGISEDEPLQFSEDRIRLLENTQVASDIKNKDGDYRFFYFTERHFPSVKKAVLEHYKTDPSLEQTRINLGRNQASESKYRNDSKIKEINSLFEKYEKLRSDIQKDSSTDTTQLETLENGLKKTEKTTYGQIYFNKYIDQLSKTNVEATNDIFAAAAKKFGFGIKLQNVVNGQSTDGANFPAKDPNHPTLIISNPGAGHWELIAVEHNGTRYDTKKDLNLGKTFGHGNNCGYVAILQGVCASVLIKDQLEAELRKSKTQKSEEKPTVTKTQEKPEVVPVTTTKSAITTPDTASASLVQVTSPTPFVTPTAQTSTQPSSTTQTRPLASATTTSQAVVTPTPAVTPKIPTTATLMTSTPVVQQPKTSTPTLTRAATAPNPSQPKIVGSPLSTTTAKPINKKAQKPQGILQELRQQQWQKKSPQQNSQSTKPAAPQTTVASTPRNIEVSPLRQTSSANVGARLTYDSALTELNQTVSRLKQTYEGSSVSLTEKYQALNKEMASIRKKTKGLTPVEQYQLNFAILSSTQTTLSSWNCSQKSLDEVFKLDYQTMVKLHKSLEIRNNTEQTRITKLDTRVTTINEQLAKMKAEVDKRSTQVITTRTATVERGNSSPRVSAQTTVSNNALSAQASTQPKQPTSSTQNARTTTSTPQQRMASSTTTTQSSASKKPTTRTEGSNANLPRYSNNPPQAVNLARTNATESHRNRKTPAITRTTTTIQSPAKPKSVDTSDDPQAKNNYLNFIGFKKQLDLAVKNLQNSFKNSDKNLTDKYRALLKINLDLVEKAKTLPIHLQVQFERHVMDKTQSILKDWNCSEKSLKAVWDADQAAFKKKYASFLNPSDVAPTVTETSRSASATRTTVAAMPQSPAISTQQSADSSPSATTTAQTTPSVSAPSGTSIPSSSSDNPRNTNSSVATATQGNPASSPKPAMTLDKMNLELTQLTESIKLYQNSTFTMNGKNVSCYEALHENLNTFKKRVDYFFDKDHQKNDRYNLYYQAAIQTQEVFKAWNCPLEGLKQQIACDQYLINQKFPDKSAETAELFQRISPDSTVSRSQSSTYQRVQQVMPPSSASASSQINPGTPAATNHRSIVSPSISQTPSSQTRLSSQESQRNVSRRPGP